MRRGMMADSKSYRSWLQVVVVGAAALVLAERLFLLVSRTSSLTAGSSPSWWREKNVDFCDRQVGRRISNPAEALNLQQKLDYLEREHLNLFDGR